MHQWGLWHETRGHNKARRYSIRLASKGEGWGILERSPEGGVSGAKLPHWSVMINPKLECQLLSFQMLYMKNDCDKGHIPKENRQQTRPSASPDPKGVHTDP